MTKAWVSATPRWLLGREGDTFDHHKVSEPPIKWHNLLPKCGYVMPARLASHSNVNLALRDVAITRWVRGGGQICIIQFT